LFSYKGKGIYILLNAKSKIITGYSIKFAKKKQLIYDLSSNNNSKNKPLPKHGRIASLQILDNFIRNKSNYQPLPLAKNIETRKPNINIDLDILDLSSTPLSLFIKDYPKNKIS
jgi:hypothetical protein